MKNHSLIINSTALLASITGIGRYVFEVSKRLSNEIDSNITYYYGYFSKRPPVLREETCTAINRFSLRDFIVRHPFLKNSARTIIKTFSILNPVKYDLYWEPNILLNPNIKALHKVVTLHDLSVEKFPEWHPEERVRYYNKFIKNTIKQASGIITGSYYTKREITEYFNLSDDSVEVIYHGYDKNMFFPGKVKTDSKPFMLFVGSVEPRKNLLNLLKAYNELPLYLKKDFSLKIAGYQGWGNKDVLKLIDQNKEYISYTGYLSNFEIAELYRSASLFIYPSFYEGFGLPPIEAMASGCPVIVSNRTSLPEVCGDAAVYIEPQSIDDITSKIKAVLEDESLRDRLSIAGISQADKYNWDVSANKHADYFREISE
ncbi:MAG TPA: glycosyltransferase family 1 protein [Deferribacteraceae bacterium]|nr:glycosyltransferase family 1 protein [Deferribacteraceae bacterium]